VRAVPGVSGAAPNTVEAPQVIELGARLLRRVSAGLSRFRGNSGGDPDTIPASVRGKLAAIVEVTVELERWRSLLLGEVDRLWVWSISRNSSLFPFGGVSPQEYECEAASSIATISSELGESEYRAGVRAVLGVVMVELA